MSTQTVLDSLYRKLGRFSPGQRASMRQLITDLYATKTIVDSDTVDVAATKAIVDAIVADAVADAVIATTGGGGTGLIAAVAQFIKITSDDANKQISLPAAVIGKVIRGSIGANGCEIISAVATDKINDVVVGATNEAAILANTNFELVYFATDNWRLITYDIKGEVNVNGATPVVPDALV